MIAIVVVASLVAYAWIMGYIGFNTSKSSNAIQIQSFALDEEGNLLVYVQNVGQESVSFKEASTVYVNNEGKTMVPSGLDGDSLKAGSTAAFTIDHAQLTTVDYTKNVVVKVVTTSGTFSQITGKPGIGGNTVPTSALTGTFTSPSSATINIGDTITVTLHVVNTGAASETGVTPSTLTPGGTGSVTLTTSPSPTSATIAAGDSYDFTWTYTAASAGTVTFSGSATGDSLTTGTVGPSSTVTINQPALPNVVISSFAITAPTESMDGTIDTSSIFNVKAMIHVTAGSVSVSATPAFPAGYVVTAPTTVSHNVGTTDVEFAWTVTAPSSASASAAVTISATATNYNSDTDNTFNVETEVSLVATKLIFTVHPSPIVAGVNTLFTIERQTASGNPTTNGGAITINLNDGNVDNANFYAHEGDTYPNVINSIILPAGSSSVNVYYGYWVQNPLPKDLTFTATSTGLTQATATVTVIKPLTAPTITASRTTIDRSEGQSSTLSCSTAASGGTTPYAYQWYQDTPSSGTNFVAISGATSASYTFSSSGTTDGTYSFYLVVTDNAGATVTSNTITVRSRA